MRAGGDAKTPPAFAPGHEPKDLADCMMQRSRSSESQSELMRKAQVAVEEARMVLLGLQAIT
jgi:hypothetical protein